MKKIVLLFLLMKMGLNVYSQDATVNDKQQIIDVINLFFKSLETKDSLLMRKTTVSDAQIWRRYSNKSPVKVDCRFSKDDLPKMHSLPDVKEIAKQFSIKIHDGIAMAWVPYEFWIEGKFSHCGIDVFTLFEMEGNWKIISVAYTVEKEKCDKLNPKN